MLGSGCASCVKLERVTGQAVTELGLDAKFDGHRLRQHRQPRHPAHPGLVVDGQVLLSGRVSTARQLKDSLTAD